MEKKPDFELDEQLECQLKMTEHEVSTMSLYNAIADNNIEAAKEAISKGADLNASNPPCCTNGGSPLDSAAYWAGSNDCSTEMIEFLKSAGATQFNPSRVKYVEGADQCPTLLKKLKQK
ncbi:MAG TPA: hypothetical protein QGF02_03430 [Candidatus Babeliales bacterium]|nr:hypothetical protein [Candidatus Babeliales bacterium]